MIHLKVDYTNDKFMIHDDFFLDKTSKLFQGKVKERKKEPGFLILMD